MAAIKHPPGAGTPTPTTRIPVTDNYALGADVHSWQVLKRHVRKGKSTWEPVTWHATLPQAATSLRDRLVRLSGAQTLEEALTTIDDASSTVSRAIAPLLGALADDGS